MINLDSSTKTTKRSVPGTNYTTFIAESLPGIAEAKSERLMSWFRVDISSLGFFGDHTEIKGMIQKQIEISDNISKFYLTVSFTKPIRYIKFWNPANLTMTQSSKTLNA